MSDQPRSAGAAPVQEWDATAYHRVSDPQFAWGLRVLERLSLRGDERVLDAGCGSGRLTRELAARVPAGMVVGCDLSENMVRAAAATLGVGRAADGARPNVAVVCADLQALPWRGAFGAAYSAATFHWVPDHDRLFAELRSALAAGAALEAQCGGGPNLARLHTRAKALASAAPFRAHFTRWRDPWVFASPEEAETRLERAGFARARCWLEEAPTVMADESRYRSFLEAVIMRPFLAMLPNSELRARFLDALVADGVKDDPPFVLDYWRLNISAAA